MDYNPDNLNLTDFLDLAILQEIQDSFAAIANVRATITGASGQLLTQPTPTSDFLRRQRAIAQAEEGNEEPAPEGPQRSGREYVAPIIVNNQRLGTIRMTANGTVDGIDEAKLAALAQKLALEPKQLRSIAQQLSRARKVKSAAIQFLYLLANAIARLCFQEFQLRQRINELTAVYKVTMMLSEARDLGNVLQRTAEVVCELTGTKASSIRLIDREQDELVIRAVHNLSDEYLNKGPIRLSQAQIDRVALSPKGYEFVLNMGNDARVFYPLQATQEGLVSMISVGMRYKGRPVGVLRLYTDHEQTFTQLQIELLKAVAAQAAAAIENARLSDEKAAAQALERQVRMARDVQQRLLPHQPPQVRGATFASVYVPCYELGGDFYDFIPLPGENVGMVVADVSGKGVPASLIMATVRAALRAQVDNVYYLYEVLRRINAMLCRDTLTGEFVTLFYGVVDLRTRRLTYCNAGHPPGLLFRRGQVLDLTSDNMVLGVDPQQTFQQSILELQAGDLLLLYTDGLTDAMNFEDQIWGRQRLSAALLQAGNAGMDPDAVCEHILWDMRRYVGLTRRTDDITMIVAKIA
jgi:sigma-B regulation protein RsbU (phosphoserine phosphatase)